MRLLVLISVIALAACSVTTKDRTDRHTEADIDYSEVNMRHGAIFMPPPKTDMKRRDETLMSKGQLIYSKYCLSCHGSTGKGDGPNSGSLNPKPADLQKIAGRMPDIHFFIQIDAGPGEMPAWRDMLSPEDLQALTHYLQHLK